MRRLLALLLFTAVGAGCGAVSHGSRLSSNPWSGNEGVYLSTGNAPRRYRVIGLVQVRGYGVQVAGYASVGDAQLDGTIKGALAREASRLGGQGVIHIEFEDENPSTEYEKAMALSNSYSGLFSRGGSGPETKDRYVTVTGEVVQFLE